MGSGDRYGPSVLATRRLCLVAMFVTGCATATPSGSQAPPQAKVRGPEVIVLAAGRTHYFENRLPNCLAYALAGEWDFASQPSALRTADDRRFVRVALHRAEAITGPRGGDAIARAAADIVAETEKDWGRRVQTNVESFPASRPGTVLLRFDEFVVTPEIARRATGPSPPAVGQTIRLPLRVIAPFDAGFVMIVTAVDPGDAREIFRTLEVTQDPQCWGRTIPRRFPGLQP